MVPKKVSAQIKSELDSVFSENGIADITYEVKGRDVIFTGEVSINYNRTAMFNTARLVKGVRNIIDEQQLYEPQPAFGQILIENEQVRFTGGFRHASNLDLIKKLIHKYFSDFEIIIEAQTSKKMIPLQQNLDYEYLFERFQGDEVWFEFSDRRVVLNGRFQSEHDLALAEQKILSQISKQTRYINDIKITGSEEAEQIVFEKEPGKISMSGALSDSALKAKLNSITKGYFPDQDISFNVSINENLQDIEWHNELVYLIPELDRLIEGRFKIYLEEIVLEGTVDEYSTKMGIIGRIKESIDDTEIIDKLIVVNK